MPWRTMVLRDARVLARCDAEGNLIGGQGGRVEIRYQPGASKAYAASPSNLMAPEDDARIFEDSFCSDAGGPSAGKKKAVKKGGGGLPPSMPAEGEVLAYCDGACSGNPGPAGLGVVVRYDGTERLLSEYLGHGTNNIAELTAIQRVAEAIDDPSLPVHIYTDSSYAIGLLQKGWKAKKNQALVEDVRRAVKRLEDVTLHHVKGHAGYVLNEAADALAVAAVESRKSAGWIERPL